MGNKSEHLGGLRYVCDGKQVRAFGGLRYVCDGKQVRAACGKMAVTIQQTDWFK